MGLLPRRLTRCDVEAWSDVYDVEADGRNMLWGFRHAGTVPYSGPSERSHRVRAERMGAFGCGRARERAEGKTHQQ